MSEEEVKATTEEKETTVAPPKEAVEEEESTATFEPVVSLTIGSKPKMSSRDYASVMIFCV